MTYKDLKIVYEDNHLLVVVKPYDVPVQADVSGHLADLLLADTAHNDLSLAGNLERDVLGALHDNRVRITQLHLQVLALERSTVTNADQLQLLLVASGHALDHVVDEGAGQTVQALGLAGVVRTGNDDFLALVGDGQHGVEQIGRASCRERV